MTGSIIATQRRRLRPCPARGTALPCCEGYWKLLRDTADIKPTALVAVMLRRRGAEGARNRRAPLRA